MTAPKQCACAPGCRNMAATGNYLCSPCKSLWDKHPSSERAIRQPTVADGRRHLADWARTRSAELVNGGQS
jgi:hypothetical protein